MRDHKKMDKFMDEKAVRDKFDKGVKDAQERAKDVQESLDKRMKDAHESFDDLKKSAKEREEQIVGSIKERPVEWTAGAFLLGLLLGKLLSRKD